MQSCFALPFLFNLQSGVLMDVKGVIADYWDKRSHTYHNGLNKLRADEHSIWVGALKDVLNGGEHLKILDLGTGPGFLALILAELGHEVTGLDISEGMLEKARYNARTRNLMIDFCLADAENLPFQDEDFDLVVSKYLLWTLPHPERAVDEWNRVLKPGGKVVLIDGVWFDPAINRWLRRNLSTLLAIVTERRNPWRFKRYYNPIKDRLPFYSGVKPHELYTLFNEAGLTNVSLKPLSEVQELYMNCGSLSRKMIHKEPNFILTGEKIRC